VPLQRFVHDKDEVQHGPAARCCRAGLVQLGLRKHAAAVRKGVAHGREVTQHQVGELRAVLLFMLPALRLRLRLRLLLRLLLL
jgi:hypothetical protein